MRKTITFIILIVAFWSCSKPAKPSADMKTAAQTEQMMEEANAQTGMPAIRNFQEKKLMKMLYEIRDQENLTTYVYVQSAYSGKLIFIGKAIGYGIPASVQFSNPERIAHKQTYNGGSFGTLPQPEPNGLFMPEGLSATYVMLIDPNTKKARPVYIEQTITVSPFRLPNAVY